MPYGFYIATLLVLLLTGIILSWLAIWAHNDNNRFRDGASSVFMSASLLLYLAIVVIKIFGPSNLVLYANSLDISRTSYFATVERCKNPDKIRLSECKAKITEAEQDTVYNYNRFIEELNKTKHY